MQMNMTHIDTRTCAQNVTEDCYWWTREAARTHTDSLTHPHTQTTAPTLYSSKILWASHY